MTKRFTTCSIFGFIVVLLGSFAPLYAGQIAESGEGSGYWKTHSVIYAKVTHVKTVTHDAYLSGTHRLEVQPLATLAGHFDCARMPKLELGVWVDCRVSSCRTVTRKDAYIVVVIRERDGYFVPSSHLKFMPEGSGLIEVEGFTDPQVGIIRDNLQRVRSKLPF